jgi:hypothetical protein
VRSILIFISLDRGRSGVEFRSEEGETLGALVVVVFLGLIIAGYLRGYLDGYIEIIALMMTNQLFSNS